jgi:hypothetical protein
VPFSALSNAVKGMWPRSKVYIIPTAVDGLGKRYEANKVVLVHLTVADPFTDQPSPPPLVLRLYECRIWRKLRRRLFGA